MCAEHSLLSVLIASRNRADYLVRCLDSVVGQDYSPVEVLVLDDCSDEANAYARVKQRFRNNNITWIRSERQLGVGATRNRLMQQARGEFLVLLDDDASFANRGCLSGIVDCFCRHPSVAALALHIIESAGPPVRGLFPFSRRTIARQPEILDSTRSCSYYIGAGHALRRSAVEEAGHYNKGSRWHHQDVDLSYRLIKLGYELLYAGALVVHHEAAPSVLNGDPEDHGELYYVARQRILFAWDHLPMPYAVTYPLIWCGFYSGISTVRLCALDFLSGLVNGLKQLRGRPRRPLNQQQLRYLRANHGRLWY